MRSLRQKKKNILKNIYTDEGHLPTKVTPVIDFTDERVVQYHVSVVKNTFDMLMIAIDKNNKWIIANKFWYKY